VRHDDSDHRTAGGADGARGPEAAESTRFILGSATLGHGPDDVVDIAVPERIGRYRVLGELGKGGMGVVYEAHDPVLDRPVAIKLVRTGRLRSEKGRQRLMREAQTIAQMSHPNIVAVYEVGSHDDQLFIAMELVVGKSLRKWLSATKRARAEILAVLEQAGEGLAAAHRVGIVQRDF
jgi:serine/threonine protein kinase